MPYDPTTPIKPLPEWMQNANDMFIPKKSVVKDEMLRIEGMHWPTPEYLLWNKLTVLKTMSDDIAQQLTLLALGTTDPDVKSKLLWSAAHYSETPYSLKTVLEYLYKGITGRPRP